MNLKAISSTQLITNLREIKYREDSLLVDLLEHIVEFEQRKLYCDLGYPSVNAYLIRDLGYSEGEAYVRIQAGKLLASVPEIKESILEGELNLTNMNSVRRAIRVTEDAEGKPVSKDDMLYMVSLVKNCNKKDALQKLIGFVPALAVEIEEKCVEGPDGSAIYTFKLDSDKRIRFERSRGLMAHKAPIFKISEHVEGLVEFYLRKTDLTQSFDSGTESPHQSEPPDTWSASSRASPNPAYIPKPLRRAVFQRDKSRCQYRSPAGVHCGSTYQVEVDHIIPLSKGGKTTYDNLRCLCRSHNQWKADRIIPE